MKILKNKDVSRQIYYEITPERQAILDLIAFTEGTDKGGRGIGYNIIYGYRRFNSYASHPRIAVTAGGWTSTAAGRYQILDKTWDLLQNQLRKTGFKPFPSFEPVYQDQAALYLIDFKQNAMSFVDNRQIDKFLNQCSWEWASLPPARYGQPIYSPKQCREIYWKYLGRY